jgi:hypothetical protein
MCRKEHGAMKKRGAFALGLAVPLLVAACGDMPAVSKPAGGAAAATCPAAAPKIKVGSSVPAGAGLVRPSPVVATVCQYAPGVPRYKSRDMQRRVVLRGQAAVGLAAVIDSAIPAGRSVPRCVRPINVLPPVTEIILGYRSLRPQVVPVVYSECDLAVLTTGGRTGVLPLPIESDLFAYTSIAAGGRGPRTPDLIGLSPSAAVAAARQRHFSLMFDGAVVDDAAQFGTVVLQALPPYLVDTMPGQRVNVVLGVRKSPVCSAGQLALSYLGGGPGAGNDFGTIVIRDGSARPCTLAGPLLVTGTGPGGRADTSTVRLRLNGVTVLSPGAGPAAVEAGSQTGELVGVLELGAEYRDAPTANGLCAPHWVVPAAWRVAFADGLSRSVANADPRNPSKLVSSGGLVTCRGRLGSPQAAYVGSP